MELDIIYNRDCLEGLKELPDESVDLIVTDPPYRITSRGNCGNAGGMFKDDLTLQGKIFNNNDIDIEDYLPEFYRVLKQDSHCYIMCNNINLIHFLKVIDDSEFYFIKNLIWDKQNKIMGRLYMGCYEYIIMLRKGGGQRQINDCGTPDLLSIPNVKSKDSNGNNIHDSQKPVALFQILIENSSNRGDVVLDTFMGSGTTALACIRSGRRYIGYEVDKKYYDLSLCRIDTEQRQVVLF